MKSGEKLTVSDLAALGRLLEEHRSRLLNMLRRRIDPALGVRIDAEEILSEAFLQASQKWPDYCRDRKMTSYAWLYRIALDCLIETWRHQTRSPRDLRRDMPWPEQSSIQLGLGLVQRGTSPSEAVQRSELCERVRTIMGCLSHQDQEILWMRHSDQLTFADAAVILGITENAATVRYARALRRLKEKWFQADEDGRA